MQIAVRGETSRQIIPEIACLGRNVRIIDISVACSIGKSYAAVNYQLMQVAAKWFQVAN
jgi:hypothetical protein